MCERNRSTDGKKRGWHTVGLPIGLALVILLASADTSFAVAAPVKVDFGSTSPNVGTQPGFEAADGGTAAGYTSWDFSTELALNDSLGVSLEVTSTSPDPGTRTKGFRDRGDITGPFAGMSELLGDVTKANGVVNFFGHETLHLVLGDPGTGNPDLNNLLPGLYQLTTWHHDQYNGGHVNIYVDDALGTGRVIATDLAQTYGFAPQNVASVQFLFRADGLNPVRISIEEIDGTTSNEEAILNGFVLYGVPEPTTSLLLLLGVLGLVFTHRRSRLRG